VVKQHVRVTGRVVVGEACRSARPRWRQARGHQSVCDAWLLLSDGCGTRCGRRARFDSRLAQFSTSRLARRGHRRRAATLLRGFGDRGDVVPPELLPQVWVQHHGLLPRRHNVWRRGFQAARAGGLHPACRRFSLRSGRAAKTCRLSFHTRAAQSGSAAGASAQYSPCSCSTLIAASLETA
jgi:hypothetical protein